MNQEARVVQELIEVSDKAGFRHRKADLYRPASEPAFSLLIVHGMAEHRRRYAEFALFMAQNNAIVLIYDQAGHGESAQDFASLGFFAERQGDQLVLDDLAAAHAHLLQRAPNIPLVILGHSMGSLILRDYLTQISLPADGIILSGTSGPNPTLPVGRILAKGIEFVRGPLFRSVFLDNLLHLGFLSKVSKPRTAFDWLTHDTKIVDDYLNDPFCGYRFTTRALIDLMAWTDRVSQPQWAQQVPVSLPILLVSGEQDPVGQFGRGIHMIYDRLQAVGRLVEMKLYSEGRHEILNELNRSEVYADLADWIKQSVLK